MNTIYTLIKPITICVLLIGTLFQTQTSQAQNCGGLGSLNLNVLPPPIPTFLAPTAICSGGNANLSVNEVFVSYLWNNGATTQTIAISAPGNYSVTVTNSGGCSGTSTVQVPASDSPIPIIAETLDTCLQQILLNVGTGYASVLWSNDSTTNEILVADTTTYIVVVRDSSGCSGTASYTAHFLPHPPVLIAGDSSVCNGNAMTLTAIFPDTATYLWSNGQTGAEIMVNTGGYYSVTATDSNGCISIDSVVLKDATFVLPGITGPSFICDTLNTTLSLPNNYAHYAWNTGADTSEIVVNWSGNYSVTVTDSNGCTGISSHTLNGSISPNPLITADPTACDGSLSLQTNQNYDAYNWSTQENSTTITVVNAGTYAVTVTTAQGCTGVNSLIASMPTLPSVFISGLDSICVGSSTSLSVSTGFAQYLWSNGANTSSISVDTGGLYTVMVTDAFGCTATNTLSMESLQLPIPEISGPVQICTAGTATFTVIGNFAAYNWNTGVNTSSITTNMAGTYSVTVTSINGCTATTLHTLSTGTNLQTQIEALPYTCNGQIDLDAGAGFSIYQWSTGQTDQNIVVLNGGTYSVTVGDGNGCTGSNVAVIVIPTAPSVDITGIPFLCLGSTSSLSATPNFTQYLWSTGEIGSNIVVTAGNTYTVTITDNAGCTGTNSLIVQELPNPSTNLNLLPYACNDQLVLIADAGFSQYEWIGPGGFTATGQQATVLMNGNYSVVVTDANGCTGLASITANIPVQGTVVLSSPTHFCPENQVVMSASAGFATYIWNNGSTLQNLSLHTAGSYTVTATDAFGCTSTASSTVSLFQSPIPVITGPASVCPGATATLNVGNTFAAILWNNGASSASISEMAPYFASVTVTDANGCTGTATSSVTAFSPPTPVVSTLAYQCNNTITLETGMATSYIWEGPNGFSSNISNPSAQISGVYGVTITDSNGCTGTASAQVTIPSSPQVSITGISTICPGQTSNLTASGGFVSYIWSNGATTASNTVAQMGNYGVTVTDAAGCTDSSSVLLNFAVVPVPTIAKSAYQCNQPIALNAGSGFNAYQWSSGSIAQNLDVTQSGTYSVTVTNTFGCTGTASVQAVIPLAPVAQIDGVQGLCAGNSAILTASGSNGLTYVWTNGIIGPALNISETGTYTVTATDAFGCTVIVNHLVEVALPVALNLARTTCQMAEVGTQIETFTATNGCDSVLTIVTTFEPTRSGYALDLESEIGANLGQEIQINVGANFDIDSVAFQSPFPLSCSNCVDPTMIALTAGFIQVEAFDPDGCFASGEIRIKVDKSVRIYVPNVFSPGSNENSYLGVFSGPEIQEVQNFHVFDRWGNALFSRKNMPTNSPDTGWDGSFRNQPMQPGVYVYYFEVLLADGSTVQYQGDVTILR